MRRRKTRKKKAPPSTLMVPDQKERLQLLLEKCGHASSPDQILSEITTPHMAAALAELLPSDDKRSVAILQALHNDFPHKEVRKAIRRAAFKLRQNGISVPPLTSLHGDASVPTENVLKEKPEAFLSLIDGSGSRGVYISIPKNPSGYHIGIGMINDEKGIFHFHAAGYSKKKMKGLKSAVLQEMNLTIPASISHALTVTEGAYEKSLEGSPQVPEDYLAFRSLLLSRWSLLDHHPVYDILEQVPDGIKPLTTVQLEKLFSHSAMESWLIDPAEMETLVFALENLEKGLLLLTEAQQEERISAIKEEWAKEHFPSERLKIMKHRLEEMAYAFCNQDEEDYARLALGAAWCGLGGDGFYPAGTVPAFLLEKTLAYYEKLRDDAREQDSGSGTESSLIIHP